MSETRTKAETGDEAGPQPERPEGGELVRRVLIALSVIGLGLWASLPTLAVIAALVFMIFMHELGHYLTARAAGMKVTEFFIGFGPRLFSFHRGEVEYGLKAIPAGAYVRIIGMSNIDEVEPEDENRTYRQKPYWRRMSVALAGSTMHFLMALVLIFVVFVGFGRPDPSAPSLTVSGVGGPAEEAGLEPGDRLVAVDGRELSDFEELSTYLRQRPGDDVELTVITDGSTRVIDAELAEENPATGEAVGFLGVATEVETVRSGVIEGARESAAATGETVWLSIKGLGAFFSPSGLSGYFDTLSGAAEESVPGSIEGEDRLLSPVGAVRIAAQAASTGIAEVLVFLFLINVFIGVFNLVPLLPLDGGHVAIATYEKVRSMISGRRYMADVNKLIPLTYGVFFVLVAIGLTALYLDLTQPIANPFDAG